MFKSKLFKEFREYVVHYSREPHIKNEAILTQMGFSQFPFSALQTLCAVNPAYNHHVNRLETAFSIVFEITAKVYGTKRGNRKTRSIQNFITLLNYLNYNLKHATYANSIPTILYTGKRKEMFDKIIEELLAFVTYVETDGVYFKYNSNLTEQHIDEMYTRLKKLTVYCYTYLNSVVADLFTLDTSNGVHRSDSSVYLFLWYTTKYRYMLHSEYLDFRLPLSEGYLPVGSKLEVLLRNSLVRAGKYSKEPRF